MREQRQHGLGRSVGARLGWGFAGVLGLLVLVVGAAVLRFAQVGDGVAQLTQLDWRSAEAAALLDATTRSNTRRTMELFFVTNPQDEAVLHQKIRENRALVDQALAELDTLLTDPTQRRSLAEIQAARAAYVRSFTQVSTLLKDGQRSQAEALLRQETLPAIDALQVPVRALAAQVHEQVSREGEALRESLLAERLRVLAGGVTALCVGLGMAIWLARGITRPLGRAVAVAEAVAQGDLSVRVGDRPADETGRVLGALEGMTQDLAQVVRSVRESCDQVAREADEMAGGTTDLSQRTEEQAASLQQTAASLEELSGSVHQNAEVTRHAADEAQAAREAVESGAVAVEEVVGTMQQVSAANRQIGEIVALVDGIAFQTNLLALNAAVEAARAGESGRGFAVVAGEVRALAHRSADAARQVQAVVAGSLAQVERGARQAGEAGQAMQTMVARVQRVTELLGEISQAASQQSDGVGQINQAVAQLDMVTQQNAALVEQSAAASEQLRLQADRLREAVQVFRLSPAAA